MRTMPVNGTMRNLWHKMRTLSYTTMPKFNETLYLCIWERFGQWDNWDKWVKWDNGTSGTCGTSDPDK